MIILVCGLPGTGKTTFSYKLARHMDAIVLSSDKIRKDLLENPTYHPKERKMIYDVMLLVAKYLHMAKKPSILDATFNKRNSRIQAKEKLGVEDSSFFIVECVCPEEIVLERIRARKGDYSDADVGVYKKMKEIYQPVVGPHFTADTSRPVDEVAKTIAQDIMNSHS